MPVSRHRGRNQEREGEKKKCVPTQPCSNNDVHGDFVFSRKSPYASTLLWISSGRQLAGCPDLDLRADKRDPVAPGNEKFKNQQLKGP